MQSEERAERSPDQQQTRRRANFLGTWGRRTSPSGQNDRKGARSNESSVRAMCEGATDKWQTAHGRHLIRARPNFWVTSKKVWPGRQRNGFVRGLASAKSCHTHDKTLTLETVPPWTRVVQWHTHWLAAAFGSNTPAKTPGTQLEKLELPRTEPSSAMQSTVRGRHDVAISCSPKEIDRGLGVSQYA